MRASLPRMTVLEAIVDKLRHHQFEVAVFSGMLAGLGLATGGSVSVLFSPNLGQQLSFPSMLKPGSLQEGQISMFGNTLLELGRPLRIEIVEGTTSVEREATDQFAKSQEQGLSIVSPAEFQPQLLEEAHEKGTRLLILILTATGGLYGATRLAPYIPLGPKRRKPLGERLADSSASISTHPLAVKPISSPLPNPIPGSFSIPVRRRSRKTGETLILLNEREASRSKGLATSSIPTAAMVIPSNTFSPIASIRTGNIRTGNIHADDVHPGLKLKVATLPTAPLVPPPSTSSSDWLGHLDVRHEQPLNTIL